MWEVRYSPFYTDDTLRQSARRVFQKFQPILHDAQEAFDRAAEGKAFKKYLRTLKTKVQEDNCRWCKGKGTKETEAAEQAATKAAKAAAEAAKAKPRQRGLGQLRQQTLQPQECGDYKGDKGCSREHCRYLHDGQKARHNPSGVPVRRRGKALEVNFALEQQQAHQQLEEEHLVAQEQLMQRLHRLETEHCSTSF